MPKAVQPIWLSYSTTAPNPCGEEKEHIEPMKSLGAWIPKPPAIMDGNQVHIAPLDIS
jgi:hypothetical protein